MRGDLFQVTSPAKFKEYAYSKYRYNYSECTFSGLPDVVGVIGDQKKILFIIELKSISDGRGDGVGQVLITAVTWSIRQHSSIFAMLLHPQKVTVYKVLVSEGSCKIQLLYEIDAGPKSHLDLCCVVQVLMIAYKFFTINM